MPPKTLRPFVAALLLMATAAACAVGAGEALPTPLDRVGAVLTRIALVETPVGLVEHPHDGALYIVTKTGRIRVMRDGELEPVPVLDLGDQVSQGPEQGLLGLAFAPRGDRLYVDYTDLAGDTRVVEYAFADGRADPSTARELLHVPQIDEHHNGGQLAFGPDGMLWIAMGDGANDPGRRAQDLSNLYGKILRLDPSPSGPLPYTIPPDNPFVGRPGVREEIWAYGLRNPWRFSFDRVRGDLWIADVGESEREEVDYRPAPLTGGENWGWPVREGSRARTGERPPGALDPIFDYQRSGGRCSIVGGFVYRGIQIPDLAGAYVFGDLCEGRVHALRQSGGRVYSVADLGLDDIELLTSFGEDKSGELYALSLTSAVYRLDPLPADEVMAPVFDPVLGPVLDPKLGPDGTDVSVDR